MDKMLNKKSYFVNQLFVVSGVLSIVLSCGLGLGYLVVFLDHAKTNEDIDYADDASRTFIETAGELSFVPSIVAVPFIMQKKGRRMALIATTIPLLLSWLISFECHFTIRVVFSVLHNIALGGAATVSSIIIAEYSTPKYRGTFLILEAVMISLGVLLSHVFGIFKLFPMISTLGLLTAIYSFTVIQFCPESPYWLISTRQMGKCSESFEWLRGQDDEAFKELESMQKKYRLKQQLEALETVKELNFKHMILNYLKTLLKADFLRPLSIMILLFSFLGFGKENLVSSYSLRGIFQFTNGKYIGTIVLDVLSLVCSLTACILIQIVKRKSLFIFTSSCSVLFLALTSLVFFLQSLGLFHNDFFWIYLFLVTGFVMFMSLGTTALPFSVLGEIFPMSYKGIGSSLTCAYLWAFSNTLIRIIPSITSVIGVNSVLIITVVLMIVILVVLTKIMPETNAKTLVEVEELFKSKKKSEEFPTNSNDEEQDAFEKLRLFIDVC